MLKVDLRHFSNHAVSAIEYVTYYKAEKMGHKVIGTDDALVGIMTKIADDITLPSPARLMFDKLNLSLSDVRMAIEAIDHDRYEKSTSTGASDGVNKALRLARRSARKRLRQSGRFGHEYTITRWDILVGLIQTNDKTFQRVMDQLHKMYPDFDFNKLKDALNNRTKASVLVMN